MYKQIQMKGDRGVVTNTIKGLQQLAIENKVDIVSSNFRKKFWNGCEYECLIELKENVDLPIQNDKVIMDVFRDVNYGVYSFRTNWLAEADPFSQFLESFEEVELTTSVIKHPTDYVTIAGAVQGGIERILDCRKVIANNPYVSIVEQNLNLEYRTEKLK